MRCVSCESVFKSLAHHLIQHPECCQAYENDDSDDSDSSEEYVDSDEEEAQLMVAEAHKSARTQMVAADLCDLRFEHSLDQAGVAKVKSSVRRWMKDVAEDVVRALTPFVLSGVLSDAQAQEVIKKVDVDIFASLETAKQELSTLKRTTSYLEPRIVTIGKETVASFDLGELLERKMQHDSNFRARVMEKSDTWKQGNCWKKAPISELADMDDGVAMRFHPHLMRPATTDEAQDVRIAINVNADDIEVHCAPLVPSLHSSPLTRFCSPRRLLILLALPEANTKSVAYRLQSAICRQARGLRWTTSFFTPSPRISCTRQLECQGSSVA